MAEQDDGTDGFKYTPNDKAEQQQNTPVVDSGESHEPQENAQVGSGDEPLFNWAAPDSFSDSKKAGWYLILLIVTVIVTGSIYLLTKDKITTGVIIVSGILIGVYATKKPRTVNYQLTRYGFTVNGRYHQFGEYRSFAVVHHGDGRSAVLTPLKRFMPYMYIYFTSDIEPKIVSALNDALPKETAHRDALDNVLRKIGF